MTADLATTLPRGFIGPDLPERIGQALNHAASDVDWRATWDDAIVALFAKTRSYLSPEETREAWTRLAHVADQLTRDGTDFPPLEDREITEAFRYAFGVEVNVTRKVVREPEPTPLGDYKPVIDETVPFGGGQ